MAEEVEKIPEIHDAEWSQWVLDQMEDDELDDGNPKVAGLIRMARKFLGPFGTHTEVKQVPTVENLNRATVIVAVSFVEGTQYFGSADVYLRNCDAPFNQYPVSTAETRALGRALRLALGIKKAAAEEISKNAEVSAQVEDEDTKITTAQIRAIENQCKRYNISVEAFVKDSYNKAKNINDVPLSRAAAMMKDLQQYQQKVPVPDALKGYDNAWRDSFGE